MGKSWAEDVQAYHAGKKQLQFQQEPVFRRTRDKSMIWRSADRSYDPVTQTLRDPLAETQRRSLEETRKIKILNGAFDRTIQTEGSRNILTHQDRLESLSESLAATLNVSTSAATLGRPRSTSMGPGAQARYRPNTGVDYNIVSNLPLSETFMAPEHLRPQTSMEDFLRLRRKLGKKTFFIKSPTDFNIVSNEYCEDHASKTAAEDEALREHLQQKWWSTHKFHPIEQRYFDDAEDSAVASAEETRTQAVQTQKFGRMPPSMQQAEGHAYDITSFEVKRQEQMEKLLKTTNKRVTGIQKTRQHMEEFRQAADQVYERDLGRAMNRSTGERRLMDFEELKRTHDILSNVDFEGVDSHKPDHVFQAEQQLRIVKKPGLLETITLHTVPTSTVRFDASSSSASSSTAAAAAAAMQQDGRQSASGSDFMASSSASSGHRPPRPELPPIKHFPSSIPAVATPTAAPAAVAMAAIGTNHSQRNASGGGGSAGSSVRSGGFSSHSPSASSRSSPSSTASHRPEVLL